MYELNSSVCRRVESRGKVTAALSGRTWWIATDGEIILKVRGRAKRYFVITAFYLFFLQWCDCLASCLAHKVREQFIFIGRCKQVCVSLFHGPCVNLWDYDSNHVGRKSCPNGWPEGHAQHHSGASARICMKPGSYISYTDSDSYCH